MESFQIYKENTV